MTKAFSSTAGFIGIILIVGFLCVMRKRGRNVQGQPQVFNSRIIMSSLLGEEKACDSNPEVNEEGVEQRKGSNNKSRFY